MEFVNNSIKLNDFKRNFRRWLSDDKINKDYVKKNTANMYVAALNDLNNKMLQLNIIDRSIFEIEDFNELEQIYNNFENSNEIVTLYQNSYHSIYSIRASFNKYLKFFKTYILGEEVEEPKTNNRKLFISWLKNKKNSRNDYFSQNTINRYINLLSNINTILNDEKILNVNLFE